MKENIYTNRKRAVIYVRVSTKEQVDEGNSLSTQQKICNDYAIKNEYEVTSIFIEQGESAKTVDRTELQKLLKYCSDKKNCIKAVIIYKLDRLSRNTDDYSQLRLLLKRYGVEIKSTSEHFENTPVGRFMENTMANISQFDNDIRSERCAGGMRDAMRDGRYVWMATVGYKNTKIGGKATISQDERLAPLILKTFQLIASNTYSTEEVRRIVTKDGLLNKKNKPFSKAYFYRMLTNELFAGWIVKFGERHKGTFTPIVSDDLFNQVQRVLKFKGRKHSVYKTDHPDFPLRKFITNEYGRKLTGSWSKGRNKKYPFYRFGGNKSNHNRDKFEEAFIQFMDKYRFDDTKFKKLKEFVQKHLVNATIDKRKECDRLKKYINELSEKQSGIIKKNLDGVIPDNVLKQQLAMIDKDLTNANASLLVIPNMETNYEEALEFVKEYLKNPSVIWRKAAIEAKIKLQWFQFPLGLTFQNKIFRTREMCLFYKAKSAFLGAESARVDFRFQKSNKPKVTTPKSISQIPFFYQQLGKEITHLSDILKEIPGYPLQ